MFSKILIANRGEIACRIMRTAKSMGIATVAVYSDADAGTPHMMMADEAVNIGGAASADSYLRGKRIIKAAQDTGAEAIHPGFGFLSENADFVEAVEAAGLVFIGPGTRAIQVMGDKIESKALASSAGVSTVPGTDGAVSDAEEALVAANSIGFPVMVKASAGGGGKGMRVVETPEALAEGMRAAMTEAQNINKSLSAIGDVMAALQEKSKHVPFRNSKLTHLMEPCLSGKGKTLMLVTVSPEESNAHESLCSLRFARQVKQCTTETTHGSPTGKGQSRAKRLSGSGAARQLWPEAAAVTSLVRSRVSSSESLHAMPRTPPS